MKRRLVLGAFTTVLALAPAGAQAAVRVTEFVYQGAGAGAREFIELTNIADADADVSAWSYNDDNPNNPVNFGAAFGTLRANESVILTEMTVDAFRAYWNLAVDVRVFSIGGSSNLGAADTINIYNSAVQSAATLVDSVGYSGTTAGVSRNRPDVVGPVANGRFADSAPGDAYGSAYADGTAASDLGNPGRYPFRAGVAPAPVPEPATWGLMLAGLGAVGAALRRRGRSALA